MRFRRGRALDPAIRERQPHEYRLVRDDRLVHWVLASGEAIFEEIDGEARATRHVGTLQGITDRQRMEDQHIASEAALRASNDRFRGAIDAVEGVLWTNDADGGMVGDQPGWAALTGQSYDEYQGYSWSKAVHPEDTQGTMEAWQQAVAQRRIFAHEHRVCRHDGVWRLFSIRAIPLFSPDGFIAEWMGVHTDITERRAAELAMAENEARLRAVVLALPFPMMLHAEDGEVLELICKWTELTGYSRDEIRTHFDWLRLAYPERRAAAEAGIVA
jgi:PAS domain S-box-containing protein